MPGPFQVRRYMPGQRSAPLPAEAMNAMLEAARAHRMGVGGQTQRPQPAMVDVSLVLVQNKTEAGLDAFQIVGLDEPVFDPSTDEGKAAFQDAVALQAVVPSITAHAGRFAVLIEPVPVDETAWAMAAGAVPCMVDIADGDHKYAEVASGIIANLASGKTGSAQILWKPSGQTGPQWCYVRLGNAGAGIPDGTAENDLLRWDATDEQWVLLPWTESVKRQYLAHTEGDGMDWDYARFS